MSVTLLGFEELDRRFQALQAVGKREVLSKALKARAEVVRDTAKMLAPHRTGRLSSGMTIKQSAETDIAEAVTQVGVGKSQFYGYFQEFGTGTSFQAAAARALGYPGHSKSKKHNMKAQPFLIPAVESTEGASIAAIERALQSEITKAENS